MQTSAKGIAALEHEEGVVLKAYRDVVGVLTIGAGLTAASGVIKPVPGMTITREEASALLARALERNYEPRVMKAMGRANLTAQHEFDAGVSFDFNTGAIHKASWVIRWREVAAPINIRAALAQWNKGGGKVLPGLVRRRAREASMLLEGIYSVGPATGAPAPSAQWASWGLSLSPAEKQSAIAALRRLGYKVGDKLDAVALDAARAFQRDHDLTVDGILGRASLTTLQRRIDAASKAKAPAVVTAAAVPVAVVPDPDTFGYPSVIPDGLEALPLIGAALWLARTAYVYRDAVAALIHQPLPRLAAFLRSF